LKRNSVKCLSEESGATAIDYSLMAAGSALAIVAAVNGLLEPSRIADHCHNLAPSLNSFRGVSPMLVRMLITLWRSRGRPAVHPTTAFGTAGVGLPAAGQALSPRQGWRSYTGYIHTGLDQYGGSADG
jgi:pilus assembly protein Flp/PilA